MLLIFEKTHNPNFREKDVKHLKHEIGSKTANVTTLTFRYDAAINGRFERRLQTFIDRLPFAYFSIRPILETGKPVIEILHFAQGAPIAKRVKHAILTYNKIASAKVI